jgi:hypothetical protein
MKSLLATAGALALLMSAAACDESYSANDDSPDVVAESPQGPADMTVPAAPAREMYALAAGEIEASDLLGASVQDMAKAEISLVEDVWLAEGSSKALLVLRDGGVAGVGGDLRTLAFDAATIVPDPDKPGDEPNVIVQLTSGTLDTLPKFKQASPDDYRLASELIGKTLTASGSGEPVRVHDLILAANGDTTYAVISPDLISTEQIVVDADKIIMAEGDADGELMLDVTAETMMAAPGYKRE